MYNIPAITRVASYLVGSYPSSQNNDSVSDATSETTVSSNPDGAKEVTSEERGKLFGAILLDNLFLAKEAVQFLINLFNSTTKFSDLSLDEKEVAIFQARKKFINLSLEEKKHAMHQAITVSKSLVDIAALRSLGVEVNQAHKWVGNEHYHHTFFTYAFIRNSSDEVRQYMEALMSAGEVDFTNSKEIPGLSLRPIEARLMSSGKG